MHQRDTSRSPVGRGRPRRTLQWARSPEVFMFYALVALSVGLLRVSTANASAHPAVPYCASASTTLPTTGAQDVRKTASDLVTGATGGCFLSHEFRWLSTSDISAGLCSVSVAGILTLLPHVQALRTRSRHILARLMENPRQFTSRSFKLDGRPASLPLWSPGAVDPVTGERLWVSRPSGCQLTLVLEPSRHQAI